MVCICRWIINICTYMNGMYLPLSHWKLSMVVLHRKICIVECIRASYNIRRFFMRWKTTPGLVNNTHDLFWVRMEKLQSNVKIHWSVCHSEAAQSCYRPYDYVLWISLQLFAPYIDRPNSNYSKCIDYFSRARTLAFISWAKNIHKERNNNAGTQSTN